MEVTMEAVRAVLESEEPDYERGRQLGEEALPYLEILVAESDAMLASKAASLAGMIGGTSAATVLASATRHADGAVRAAAAYGLRGLPPSLAEPLEIALMRDEDADVVNQALRTAAIVRTETVIAEARRIASSEDQPAFLRRTAQSTIEEDGEQ